MGRHVIILGAGASMSSGYPSAYQLRLLMTSPAAVKEWFGRYYLDFDLDREKELITRIQSVLAQVSGKGLRLFRDGAFATVDEFSKLATKGEYATYVPELKNAMRIALGIRNPEHAFHSSDYVPFVQRLFLPDEAKLREDVTVLSFNYDTYLEYVLARAFKIRRHVDEKRVDEHSKSLNAITSGYFNVEDRSWLDNPFKILKLHGSLAFVEARTASDIGYGWFFNQDEVVRQLRFLHLATQAPSPPVVFPWEIFGTNQREFVHSDEFCPYHDDRWPREALFNLLKDIWLKAREAIQIAEKISFVGISAHSYLTAGFRFLFEGKTNEFEAVVSNPQNKDKSLLYEPESLRLNPLSVSGRINALLKAINCKPRQYPGDRFVRTSTSFSDFIGSEM